jgi:hypothetical protein
MTQMPQYSYTAYGLNIRSEIHLSVRAGNSSAPDLQIRKGKVEFPPESDDRAMWTTPDAIFFRLRDIGSMRISRGREIVIDTFNDDDQVAALLAVGPAMGAALHQRGLLVLHGSAVVVDGGVVAFLGFSGWGKSTMAGAMVKLGNASFCDDLVPVSLSNGAPVVLPGYPFLKLAPESGEFLGFAPDSAPLVPNDNRHMIAVGESHPGVPLPLARVYVLSQGDRPEIERLKPQEAAVELIRHSYTANWIRKTGMSARHLECVAGLVERLPICRLSRPRRLDLIHEIAELVERDVRKECEV